MLTLSTEFYVVMSCLDIDMEQSRETVSEGFAIVKFAVNGHRNVYFHKCNTNKFVRKDSLFLLGKYLGGA